MGGDDEPALLLDNVSPPQQPEPQLHPQRYYLMFLFALVSLVSYNQNVVWVTYSPISTETQTYYMVDASGVNLLLNWGPILYIMATPFVMTLAQNELRPVVLLAAVLRFLSGMVRIVPSIFPETLLATRGRSTTGVHCSYVHSHLLAWLGSC